MRRSLLIAGAAFALRVLLPTATAGPGAARIIDRALSCPVGLIGGVYQVDARAARGIKHGAFWSQLPFAIVSSGSVGSRTNALDDSLVSITAGEPSEGTSIDTERPIHDARRVDRRPGRSGQDEREADDDADRPDLTVERVQDFGGTRTRHVRRVWTAGLEPALPDRVRPTVPVLWLQWRQRTRHAGGCRRRSASRQSWRRSRRI
jgi:hypothetical protein